MNVRLQCNMALMGAVHFNDALQINAYQINLSLKTRSVDRAAINVAMDRLRCFIHAELVHAVFVNQNEQGLADTLAMIGANPVTLPCEPTDQAIGIMLFCKLNAIMEGVIHVTALDIASTLGDDVWFEFTEEDSMGCFAEPGWWSDSTTVHNNLCAQTDDNVVKVMPNHWAEYDLLWPDTVDKHTETQHNVVYAKFPKNEN